MRKPRPLTPKQKKFCVEYPVDFNAKQAYIRAGYAPKSAEAGASMLLRNLKVQAELGKCVEQSFGVSKIQAAEVIQMIKDMACVDPVDIFDKNGQMLPLHDIPKAARLCISGITHTKFGPSVKLEGRLKALEMLGKYLKLWSDGLNVNIDGGDEGVNVTFEFTGLGGQP